MLPAHEHAPLAAGRSALGAAVDAVVEAGPLLAVVGAGVLLAALALARSRRAAVRVGVGLLTATAVAAAAWDVEGRVPHRVALVVHLGGVTAWAVAAALVAGGRRSAAPVAPLALCGATTTVASGVVLAGGLVHPLTRAADAAPWVTALGAKAVLVTATAGAGLVVARRRRGRRTATAELVGLAAAAILGGALGGLPPPAALDRSGGAQLLTLAGAGGLRASLALSPGTPGLNAFDLSVPGGQVPRLTAGGTPVPLAPAGRDRWRGSAPLRAGHPALVLRAGTLTARGRADIGRPRDEGTVLVERLDPAAVACADRSLGHLLAVAQAQDEGLAVTLRQTGAKGIRLAPCTGASDERPGLDAPDGTPVVRLGADATGAGQALATFYASRDLRRPALLAHDGDPAAAALERGWAAGGGAPLRRIRPGEPGPVPDLLLLAVPPADGAAAVAALDAPGAAPERGVALAPWLLDGGLLRATSDGPQQVAVATLPVGTPAARALLILLDRHAPGRAPTAGALAGYLEARLALGAAAAGTAVVPSATPLLSDLAAWSGGPPGAAPISLLTGTSISVLPAELGHRHRAGPVASWVPGGALSLLASFPSSPAPP